MLPTERLFLPSHAIKRRPSIGTATLALVLAASLNGLALIYAVGCLRGWWHPVG